MLMSVLFIGLLDAALHQALRLSPLSQAEIHNYDGKCLGVEIQNLNIFMYLHFSQGSISLLAQPRGQVNAMIHGAPFTLSRMMLERNHQPISSGEVKIDGDMHLAQEVADTFARFEIDWEEWLAHNIGDVAAHWLGNQHRAASAWRQQSLNTCQLNLAEYLQEEARLLPAPLELQAFYEDVDELRADIERLAQRMQRIADRNSQR